MKKKLNPLFLNYIYEKGRFYFVDKKKTITLDGLYKITLIKYNYKNNLLTSSLSFAVADL